VKRSVLGLILVLAAGCGRPWPWERPAPAKNPPPLRSHFVPESPPAAVPDWAVGLSEKVRQEMEGLQGTWVVTRVRRNRAIALGWAGSTVTLTGNQFTSQSGQTTVARGTWTVDPTQEPYSIDLHYTEGSDQGQKLEGLYQREGGAWVVLFSAPGQRRPASFLESEPDQLFLTLNRQTNP
jgi:uncharacterized protein (TIGR03067 family)